MGTYTITINAPVTPIYSVSLDESSDCSSNRIIDVDHQGTDLYIEIISSGDGANMNFNEVITADKTYHLIIEGSKSSQSSQNIKTGTIVMRIREENTVGNILTTILMTRNHTGDYC